MLILTLERIGEEPNTSSEKLLVFIIKKERNINLKREINLNLLMFDN